MLKFFLNKKLSILSAVLFIVLRANCQDSLSVMFYNVENLFDTLDDSTKNDNEFLPQAKKKWDYYKWNEKTDKIAKVIAANNFPDAIGLAEIENDTVLKKLVHNYLLRDQSYDYIHFESNDFRGIDCALLFKRNKLNLLQAKNATVNLNGRPTRDILVTTFKCKNDTISLLVNHWPSRYGGWKKSEPKRLQAAKLLKHVMDSIQSSHQSVQLIAMGDFNDEPTNESLKTLCNYKNYGTDLVGTIKYRGIWQTFDMFITNQIDCRTYVYKPAFLLEEDKRYGGDKPFRTYYGPMYHRGFSDHLPVLLKSKLN